MLLLPADWLRHWTIISQSAYWHLVASSPFIVFGLRECILELYCHSKKIKPVMQTTYKVFLKYQANATSPSLCLTSRIGGGRRKQKICNPLILSMGRIPFARWLYWYPPPPYNICTSNNNATSNKKWWWHCKSEMFAL